MFKKSGIALILIVFITVVSLGNTKIDSLKNIITTSTNDSLRAHALATLAYNSYGEDLQYTDSLFNSAIALAKVINPDLLSNVYYLKGVFKVRTSDLDTAFTCLNKALSLIDTTERTNDVAQIYWGLGKYYKQNNSYFKAIHYHRYSLAIYFTINDQRGVLSNYLDLSSLYYFVGQYEKALEYAFKALQLSSQLEEYIAKSVILTNISNYYSALNKLEKAIEYQVQALELDKIYAGDYDLHVDYLNLTSLYDNMGDQNKALASLRLADSTLTEKSDVSSLIELKIAFSNHYWIGKDRENALKYALEANELLDSVNDKEIKIKTYINLARAYYLAGKTEQSIAYYNKTNKAAKEIGWIKLVMNSSEKLSELYAETGNYKQAYTYSKMFHVASDSLMNKQKVEDMVKSELEYEYNIQREKERVAAKEKELVQLGLIEKQKYINRFAIVIIIVVVLVSIFILILNRLLQRKKRERLQSSLYLSRQQILAQQMNPHFIFNVLNAIQNHIYKNKPEESVSYLSEFAHLIRRFLNNSLKVTVTLNEEMELLRNYASLENRRLKYPMQFKVDISEDIDMNQINIPTFLIQPLLENAIKHGIQPLQAEGKITLTVQKRNDGILYILEDNGVGLKQSEKLNEGHKSLGTSLLGKRLQILSLYHNKAFTLNVKERDVPKGSISGTRAELFVPDIL